MTSSAKINANRVNARASTGPKTQQGRARSAQNALRHGLSLPVEADPVLSEEIETLAREVAGPDANARRQECARHVAAAQIDLRRVRHARHQLLSRALRDPYFDSSAGAREKIRFISDLLRPNAPDIPIADLGAYLTATPQGPSKFAAVLSECTKALAAMDRYERRALSRRKFAIRAFDEMRLSQEL